LVVPVGDADVEDGDAPVVALLLVQLDAVLEPGQALAEAADVDEPRLRLAHRLLEGGPEPGQVIRMAPLGQLRGALEAVAADEAGALVGDLPEAWDVDAVGPVAAAVGDAVEHGQHAGGAAAGDVV